MLNFNLDNLHQNFNPVIEQFEELNPAYISQVEKVKPRPLQKSTAQRSYPNFRGLTAIFVNYFC